MSLCCDKSCVPCAIKIQNYARQTEVEEVHTLPEMITTEARSLFFLFYFIGFDISIVNCPNLQILESLTQNSSSITEMSGWSTHGCPLEVKGNISLHMWIRVSGYPCRYKILNFPSNNSVSALSVINMWRVQLQKVYPWCFFKHSVFFSQEKRQIQPFPRGKGKKNSAHENVWCRYVVSVYSVPWQYAILWKIQ